MKRKYIILLHIAVWSLLLVSNLWNSLSRQTFSSNKNLPLDLHLFTIYLIIEVTYLLVPLCCFYSAYVLVAPQLIVKKNYFKAVLYSILTLAFVEGLRYVSEYYFFLPFFGFDNYRGNRWSVTHYITNIFFYYFPTYFIYGLMYYFVEGWYKNRQDQQEFQKEKAAAELTFLRSQINPHFLFNTINDIYSLTYQQSAQAPAALLKLSDILRYMLKDGKEDTVLLQNEVKYIEDVIALQQISAKGNARINFNIEGCAGNQKVGALLFIAFVENAFKHGILTDPENPVQINLRVTDSEIQFMVNNRKNTDQKDKTPGIGLNNVRRRLALLYPGKHNLTVNDQPGFYTVNLELQLI